MDPFATESIQSDLQMFHFSYLSLQAEACEDKGVEV